MGIKPLQCTQYKAEAFSPTADNSACCNQLGRGIIAAAPGSTLLRVTCILLEVRRCSVVCVGGGNYVLQCGSGDGELMSMIPRL